MNIPVLMVALVLTAALAAHLFIGTRETASLEPQGQSGKPMMRWVQAMAAWQMLSLDLAALTGLLYLIALTDRLPAEGGFIRAIAIYFAAQGLIWLGTVLWYARPGASLLALPHWAVWWGIAAVLWFSA